MFASLELISASVVRAPAGREVTTVPVPHVSQTLQQRVMNVERIALLLVMLVMLHWRHAWLRHEG